jgi:hypothetical protein
MGNFRVHLLWVSIILTFNTAIWIRMLYWKDGHDTTFYIGVSPEISGYTVCGYWRYLLSIRLSELKFCTRWPRYYGSYWSLNSNFSVLIPWILTMCTCNKSLWIGMLDKIDFHDTRVDIGVSTEITGYRYSAYWQYLLSIGHSDLECWTK